MNSPIWVVKNRELQLHLSETEQYVPSMEEVYSYLVDKHNHNNIPTAIENINIIRYPAIPYLILSASSEVAVPSYSIEARFQGKKINILEEDLTRGHFIDDAAWYPIDTVNRDEIIRIMQEYGIEIGVAKSLRSYLKIKNESQKNDCIDDQIGDIKLSPLAFISVSNEAPKDILATLYPYQISGWGWLKFLLSENIGGLLADEMGLGKTLQIISVLSDSGSGDLSPSLIVAPGSILENWRREIQKFAPHLKVLKHHGPARTGNPSEIHKYDVVITSYENVVRDNSLLNMVLWEAVILDEAQFIRNPSAQRTKSVKHLKRKAGLAVTGTPVENRLQDLWSIIDFVMPGYLGSLNEFESKYTNDEYGAMKIEPIVSPLMLRRRVREVAKDLPERIDIPQILELEKHEVVSYKNELNRIKNEYGAAATIVALTSLRRFCSHPILMGDEFSYSDLNDFSKFKRLSEIVEQIYEKNEKVIIFTSFTRMADLIAEHIKNTYQGFVDIIDGRIEIDERQEIIDNFSITQGSAALILNPKAGGSGLNITAANHVIHYNPEWNPALEDQASARAYRRGQTLPVTVHRLIVADTVEEVISDRLDRKRLLSDSAVVGISGGLDDYADIISALSRYPRE